MLVIGSVSAWLRDMPEPEPPNLSGGGGSCHFKLIKNGQFFRLTPFYRSLNPLSPLALQIFDIARQLSFSFLRAGKRAKVIGAFGSLCGNFYPPGQANAIENRSYLACQSHISSLLNNYQSLTPFENGCASSKDMPVKKLSYFSNLPIFFRLLLAIDVLFVTNAVEKFRKVPCLQPRMHSNWHFYPQAELKRDDRNVFG